MAIDPNRYRTVRPAPCVVFDNLDERATRPRFWIRGALGPWTPVTWGEYADATRDAALFCAESLQPGERAALFAGNSVQWASAAMGIQAVGGVMVPIYPASTAEQAAYVLRHADVRVLFVAGAELLARILSVWDQLDRVRVIVVLDDTDPSALLRAGGPAARAVEAKLVHWSTARARGAAAAAANPGALAEHLARIDPRQPALMLYTSGSTGQPKGVPLTHTNLGVNTSDWLRCNAPRLRHDAVDLLWLPMSHIFGLGELCSGDLLGWTSYLSTPWDVLVDMPQVRPHVFMSVPAYWDKLAKTALAQTTPDAQREALDAATGGRLEFCLSGGAGLDRGVKELFLACGRLILEGYGLTECSPTLTLNRPNDFRFDSVGKAVPSVSLRLGDDGEILARGPSIFSGYHDDPEATAAAFTADGWFRTGDLGRFTDDGFLQIVGRKKEILVTAGGKNIAPANIETRLCREPAVQHAVVYGDGKKYLVAALWVDPAAVQGQTPAQIDAGLTAAVAAANADLARFEQIKKWVRMEAPLTVDGGMLTSTLKLRRREIYAAYAAQLEALYA